MERGRGRSQTPASVARWRVVVSFRQALWKWKAGRGPTRSGEPRRTPRTAAVASGVPVGVATAAERSRQALWKWNADEVPCFAQGGEVEAGGRRSQTRFDSQRLSACHRRAFQGGPWSLTSGLHCGSGKPDEAYAKWERGRGALLASGVPVDVPTAASFKAGFVESGKPDEA